MTTTTLAHPDARRRTPARRCRLATLWPTRLRPRRPQLRPHPPDPREAARRHAAAADVRAAVRLRLRRSDRGRRRHYREYLIGGILVQSLAFGMMGPAVVDGDRPRRGHPRPLPLAADVAAGLPARPLHRRARRPQCWRSSILLGTGLIVGWRIHSDPAEALAGFAFLVPPGARDDLARHPDWRPRPYPRCGPGVAFLVVFPLTFVAATFVPIAGLPTGLRQFAEYNPVSSWAAAVRTLFGNPTATPADAGWPLQHPVLCSVLWCVGLIAVIAPLTLAAYRRRTVG